ncbi:3'-5' exonuclease [Arcobacter lacus]|uniref:3'-5' exonuclease n=1 Tax=Arcobacteraceae TaxID=2808963 RepID=UPI0021B28AE9|nr:MULTISPECIES: 3'-5' exonuclease [Arcobacteraceae]MCT7629428.1 3'-5' exonuclease [Aliarcobacter butzleri]MCT7908272.1 3'-5' exonuclease [Arcobacter lacus]MCT7910760.1 3'-5' exonuclease [Arcobacter lacus]
MFRNIKNYFNKKNLRDKKYLYLFEDSRKKDEYVCFDCETTGLNPKKDDIISIGAVIIKDNMIISSKKFIRYVKPKTKLQAEAIKVHHIRECDLNNANDIDLVIEEFLEFIGNRTLVGYFLEFDISMINKYLKPKIGITLPNKTLEVSEIYHDYKIEIIPQGHIDLRFNSIMEELQIPSLGKHDAYNDALMTAMIFLKLKNTVK